MDDQIARVTNADHEDWLPLWRSYQAFYKTDISPETSRTVWSRFLDDEEPMHAALFKKNGKALGLVHWVFHRSCWTTGDYCYLQDLFVSPEARKTGVGTALIQFVYQQAKMANASRVYWLTHQTNLAGISLYRKLAEESGFIQFRHAPDQD